MKPVFRLVLARDTEIQVGAKYHSKQRAQHAFQRFPLAAGERLYIMREPLAFDVLEGAIHPIELEAARGWK